MRISEIETSQSDTGPGVYEVFEGNKRITLHRKKFNSYEDAVKYFKLYHVWSKGEGPEIPPHSIRKVEESPKPAEQKNTAGYYMLLRGNQPYDMYESPKYFKSYEEAKDWYTKYRIAYAVKNKGDNAENFRVVPEKDVREFFDKYENPSSNPKNILSDPEYFRAAKEFWINYWGEGSQKGLLKLLDYSGTVDSLTQDGGTIYRVVFLKDFKDLNREDLGSHWTVDYDIAARHYASGAEGQHHSQGGKDVHVLLTCKTPPNNIENLHVDVRGNPEEEEVNIINPKICKFTAQIIGTKEVIQLN